MANFDIDDSVQIVRHDSSRVRVNVHLGSIEMFLGTRSRATVG
jgi:hypothetical protein